MTMKAVLAVLALLVMVGTGRTDTLLLQSGGHVDGIVMKEADGKVTVHLKHGMVTMNRDDIASIIRDEPSSKGRIVPWTACYRALAKCSWGSDLRPTTALVIQGGPFRNVPYISDRAGNREFNLYGDPDHPAGLEFGLSKFLTKDADARKEVIALLKSLLTDAKDQEALASLDPKVKGRKECEGLVVEIEEASNSAGDPTCFITVYDSKAVDEARVLDKDVPKAAPISDTSGKPGPGSTTVAAPGAPPASPGGSTTSSTDAPGTFGFSPSALSGEMPQPSRPRSYAPPGVDWSLWWRQNHPPPPPPPPPAKKPAKPSNPPK
jgi:hypothetical protein